MVATRLLLAAIATVALSSIAANAAPVPSSVGQTATANTKGAGLVHKSGVARTHNKRMLKYMSVSELKANRKRLRRKLKKAKEANNTVRVEKLKKRLRKNNYWLKKKSAEEKKKSKFKISPTFYSSIHDFFLL